MTPPIAVPDCPFCDAAATLSVERADYQGSAWYLCSCCARRCLVKDGRIVHPAMKSDISGVPMFDP